MKQWEYRTVIFPAKSMFSRSVDTSKIDKELNKLGKEGWELFNTKHAAADWGAGHGIMFVFKRRIDISPLKSEPTIGKW